VRVREDDSVSARPGERNRSARLPVRPSRKPSPGRERPGADAWLADGGQNVSPAGTVDALRFTHPGCFIRL
ncbi:hypothetical protein, partial [Cronobacter muytjensii]|uniref:hypothetical protein n=1 Tax=Cronobacter muytjensii TaxID=413501 RepID=UPI001F27E4C7